MIQYHIDSSPMFSWRSLPKFSSSHLALLGSHALAHLSTSWPLVTTRSSVSLGEASLSASTHILLCVRVVELLLLTWHGSILAHVHGLLPICHLAVLQLVAGQLVGVDHRKHLRETLTNTGDSLGRITEWQLVPRHELNTLSVHVNQALLARCT